MNKAMGTIEIDKFLEVEISRSLRQSKHTAAVPHPASAEQDVMADNLGTLFSRMTKLSVSEVERLIDELQMMRKKLEADGDLIERAIARHSEHSQGVMQLTTFIADNVKKLPNSTLELDHAESTQGEQQAQLVGPTNQSCGSSAQDDARERI